VLGFPGLARRLARGLGRAKSRGAADAVLRAASPEALLAFAAQTPSARRAVWRHLDVDRGRRLPLDGTDLMALGLRGPPLGRALAARRVAFLDGECQDREQAAAWLRARRKRFEGRGRSR
jgi:hypothetical protein